MMEPTFNPTIFGFTQDIGKQDLSFGIGMGRGVSRKDDPAMFRSPVEFDRG